MKLDPLAVSVVVIKSLSMLHVPLLGAAARAELFNAAIGDFAGEVRISIISDVLHRLPPNQGRLLKVIRWRTAWQPPRRFSASS